MHRSLTICLPLMALAVCTGNALGVHVTSNGSRICDSSRVGLVAIDANYTLPSNSNKIIYAAGVNDPDECRIRIGEGGHTLQVRVIAGSWADVPLSSSDGPHLAASGTVLVHDTTVSESERRANSGGFGSYVASAKQFTSSTTLDFPAMPEIRLAHSEGQWALDFSNCPSSVTYEFRVRWGTKDCGDQYVTYPAQITTAGHHWNFDETSGTTAADSIGSSDGTLTNFPGDDSQWSCQDGGSLIFDGVDDYVSLPTESDYDFTAAVTVAAWIKVTSFTVAEQAIVTKGDIAYRLERNASTNTLQFSVDGLTTNTVVQGSVSVNDGNWHHVAGVYDGSELLLYIDGVEDNAVTATGTMGTNNSAVHIGANAAVAGRNFKGLMNDLYIYSGALTPSAILSLAQRLQLGWWKLDETSGTTAYDSSAYANNGTLQNMAGTEWTTGKIDGGLDFVGTSDHIDTNVASNLATSSTMMAWFKSDDAGSIGSDEVAQRFMTQRRDSTNSRLALGINNDRIAVYWHDGGSVIQEATTTVTAGQWYHAAVTYDGTTVRLYVNGVENGNWPESSMSTPSADTHQIAVGGSVRYFDGVLDDVRLHSQALCAAEIAAIAQQGGVRIVTWREIAP